MAGKVITEKGLNQDLGYLMGGIDCHEVLFEICPPRPGLKVLEAGCGSGKLGLRYALVSDCYVELLDLDAQAIEYSRRLWEKVEEPLRQNWRVNWRLGSVLDLPYGDEKYDLVFNEGVPHHWGFNIKDTRRQRCLNEMARVTKSGGFVVVIGSNAHCPATMRMAETTKHTYPGMPERQKPFTLADMAESLIKSGLAKVGISPVSGFQEGLSWDNLEPYVASPLIVGWGQKP